MTEVRRASEERFPYGWPATEKVCYFEVAGDAVNWLHTHREMREAVTRALAHKSVIYAAWPGQRRTDLFTIDEPARLAKAIVGTSAQRPYIENCEAAARTAEVPITNNNVGC